MNLKTCIVANWKMNLNFQEAEDLLHDISLCYFDSKKTDITICVPFPFLPLACSILKPKGIHVGAQDCSAHAFGAYTGEVSASMIHSCGAEYVIIGHSERRMQHHETASLLSQKIIQALEARLHIIFCVGESALERTHNTQFDVITQQLTEVWPVLNQVPHERLILAYEPVWAIGTGKSATPDMAQEMHAHIKKFLHNQNTTQSNARTIKVLYGGSCTPENASALFKMADIDGALVGGASLKSKSFSTIINAD
jgi:triosephosphate isomerase